MNKQEHANDRTSWMMVNAYGVFLALMLILVGLRQLIYPEGYILAAVGYSGYMISGLALFYSYAKVRVDFEVYGSVLLVGSNLLVLTSKAVEISDFNWFSVLMTLTIITTVMMRIISLMRGGTYILPKWRR